MKELNVKLEIFEGPLDLLLHLIKTLEIDIYDIPISEITEQYMYYIRSMKELDLELAGEYIVMAATLIEENQNSNSPKDRTENRLVAVSNTSSTKLTIHWGISGIQYASNFAPTMASSAITITQKYQYIHPVIKPANRDKNGESLKA
jgi:hypothetical protein